MQTGLFESPNPQLRGGPHMSRVPADSVTASAIVYRYRSSETEDATEVLACELR